MTEPNESQASEKPRARGEAAWKAEKDRIAARNQAVQKAGRAQRKVHDERLQEQRRTADLRDIADVRRQHGDR
jgi:hypothetical protein